MKTHTPYLKWRVGRPRWEPGPGLRAAGFPGRDLKDGAGRWLDQSAAIAAADELNAQVAAWRTGAAPRRRKFREAQPERTLDALWRAYQASPFWADLAATTQRDYANKARVILDVMGGERVAAVRKSHMQALWQRLHTERGHAMANGVMAVARLLFSHALLHEWATDNPVKEIRMTGLPPRLVVWTPSEIAHFIADADKAGDAEIADAVIIALHSGQRQGDVLALDMPEIEGHRVLLRQSKTGQRIAVPYTDALTERLADIRRRRNQGRVVAIAGTRAHLIVDKRGEPYKSDWFRSEFRRVRSTAAEKMPSLLERQFLDLRDTAVTRLALAGCTLPEICAITGHQLATATHVLKHYLALDDRMAAAGIARLKTWMAAEGIAI